MGRPKRIQFAGACYLIALRGNNRQDLFVSNQDRRLFLSQLKAYKDRFGLKIYAYSLLAKSASLLIETERPNLSAVMQALNTQYTKSFNAAHGTVGHVFQGRYRAWVVDKSSRLAEVSRWVHLECAREGLHDKPWRYQWSSCAAYVEAQNREPLVDSDAVLKAFGGSRLKQSVRYLQYLQDHPAVEGETLPIVAGVAVGDHDFLERVGAWRETPAPRPVPVEAARRIIADIAARRGVSEEKILGRVQWREVSVVRREAVHRVWRETRMGVTELARLFGRTPSAISQTIRALEDAPASSMN